MGNICSAIFQPLNTLFYLILTIILLGEYQCHFALKDTMVKEANNLPKAVILESQSGFCLHNPSHSVTNKKVTVV